MIRRTWRVGGAVFAALMLVLGAAQTIVTLAHEQRTVERTFPADGIQTVEVHNRGGGAVELVGSERDTVRVVAHIDDGLRETDHSERIEGDRLVLESSCPLLLTQHCNVSYVVEAPAGVNVVIRTDAGHISVGDIDGDVDVGNDVGGIDLTRIGGSLQVHTDAGGINAVGLTGSHVTAASDAGRVSVDFDRAPQTVVATSDAGAIDVVLPPGDAVYQVTGDSDAGDVTTEVRTDPFADRTIVATSNAGAVTIRYGTSG
jgi:hypothetical protein